MMAMALLVGSYENLLTDCVSVASHMLIRLSSQPPYEIGTIITLILQMRKLRDRRIN